MINNYNLESRDHIQKEEEESVRRAERIPILLVTPTTHQFYQPQKLMVMYKLQSSVELRIEA